MIKCGTDSSARVSVDAPDRPEIADLPDKLASHPKSRSPCSRRQQTHLKIYVWQWVADGASWTTTLGRVPIGILPASNRNVANGACCLRISTPDGERRAVRSWA